VGRRTKLTPTEYGELEDAMPKVIDEAALFETVVTVFAENGYAATATAEIARRAGINEATLFRRFGTKALLVQQALAHCLQRSTFADLASTSDVRADLIAIVEAYAATNRAYGGAVATLLTDASRFPELRESLATLFPNMRKAGEIIATHQTAGRLVTNNPIDSIALLLAPEIAMGLWRRSGAAPFGSDLSPEHIVDSFLDGQAPR
jgi:AcrR family transcriptional regulator